MPATQLVVKRLTANFPASVWGDQFLVYNQQENQAVVEKVVEDLQEEIRDEILRTLDIPTEHTNLLKLLDAIQRLGIESYFEAEVNQVLQNTSMMHMVTTGMVVLLFFGFESCDNMDYLFQVVNILNSYKGRDGTFKEPLENDIEGLLELFEATYLGVPGEIMIDDALAFTRGRLEHILKDPSLKNTTVSKQIEEALKRPLHKRLPRLEALRYIPFYQQQASHNESLLKLAMLGFNLLQSLHKIELSQISMWWKRYDVPNNLPYARNRLVECYFWSLSVFFEPQYSQSRMFLAKFISVETLLDDTYDAYGTYEELEMIEYIESYLKEAKWAKDGYIPSMEEHQEVTLVSSGYKNTLIASFCAMGVVITDDTFKWALTMPPIAKACCVLCRVMDDIVTHKLHHDCIFSATKLTFKMG
ncbi:alpha-isocomene synthase-like [Bidens hawaiensis]|uniref:alpha-isocomene synthase-like n=1 Tax=Bidens hawaiensis TaxID=980011 RepID=UPI00404A3C73